MIVILLIHRQKLLFHNDKDLHIPIWYYNYDIRLQCKPVHPLSRKQKHKYCDVSVHSYANLAIEML